MSLRSAATREYRGFNQGVDIVPKPHRTVLTVCFLALPLVLVTTPSAVTAADEPIELTLSRDELIWTVPIGETFFDVVRGDLQTLIASDGSYVQATEMCMADDTSATSLFFPVEPSVPGQGFWFLVRGEVSTLGYETPRWYETPAGGQVDGRDGEINVSDGACPEYRCAADIPPSYDQVNTIAGGACVEWRPFDGPPACPEAEYLRADRDISLIKDAYPFTRSVEAAVVPGTGSGQVFDPGLDVLMCSGFEAVPASQSIFDELNACYRATPRCLINCNLVWPEFDWMVRVTDLLEIYSVVAERHGGTCALDRWLYLPLGPTPGFHATQGALYWRWLVRADEQCDGTGCQCDGWVQVLISETGEITEEVLVNNSTSSCAGSRWNF